MLAPLLALLLTSCSGATLVDALVPSDGYHLAGDLRYRDGPRGTLDVYVPDAVEGSPPLVVFLYGGGWESGAKEDYRFAGQAFASRGHITAIPDYRLYPEVKFPDFLRDAAAAVVWARRHAAEWGAADGPVHLVGHSAGAHIAAMLTLDERWLAEAGMPVGDAIRATVGLAGPYDFLPLTEPVLMEIFGPEATRSESQPINFVDGTEPPMLLATGTDDTRVRPRNTANLAGRITERGGRVETLSYDGIGHIQLVAALAAPLRWLAPVLSDIDTYLRRQAP
jgi:acetyl esterase/lipase